MQFIHIAMCLRVLHLTMCFRATTMCFRATTGALVSQVRRSRATASERAIVRVIRVLRDALVSQATAIERALVRAMQFT